MTALSVNFGRDATVSVLAAYFNKEHFNDIAFPLEVSLLFAHRDIVDEVSKKDF